MYVACNFFFRGTLCLKNSHGPKRRIIHQKIKERYKQSLSSVLFNSFIFVTYTYLHTRLLVVPHELLVPGAGARMRRCSNPLVFSPLFSSHGPILFPTLAYIIHHHIRTCICLLASQPGKFTHHQPICKHFFNHYFTVYSFLLNEFFVYRKEIFNEFFCMTLSQRFVVRCLPPLNK